MVHLTIESTGETEEMASHDVALTCDDLRATLEPLCPREEDGTATPDAAVLSLSASHIYMATKNRHEYDPRDFDSPGIYDAVITMGAVFCDFNELRRIHSQGGYDEIGAESRKEAVLDAVTKANQYAQAAGFEDITPVDIREIDEPSNPSALRQRPTYRHPSVVNLSPQDMLNCCVQVVFETGCDLGSGSRTD